MVTEVTSTDDFATDAGHDKALNAYCSARNAVMVVSLPAAGGCGWHRAIDRPGATGRTRAKLRGHQVTFWALWAQLERLAKNIVEKTGQKPRLVMD